MNRRYGWLFIGLGAILAISPRLLVFYLIRQQELRAIEQARQEVQLLRNGQQPPSRSQSRRARWKWEH